MFYQFNGADNDKFFTLGFASLAKIGPIRFRKIIGVFKSAEAAWQAPLSDYEAKGIPADIIKIVETERPKIDLEKEWERLKKNNIDFICASDQEYPALLKEIHNPPIGLFARGKIPEREISVAIVGTRKATHYGLNVAKTITQDLIKQGIIIVSGLALGIDTASHKSAIEMNGKTIAVLGGGIDEASLYPPTNRSLAQKISNGFGAVISEYPIGTPSLTHHFPNRNRIISGLSKATIVVEADLESGALITARFALEQNREVFAIPGNITNPYSAGPNALIKQGAQIITSAADVLETLNIPQIKETVKAKKIFPSSPEEIKILEIIDNEPIDLDLIIRTAGLDTKIVHSTLTVMEMKGLVKNIGAGFYIKNL